MNRDHWISSCVTVTLLCLISPARGEDIPTTLQQAISYALQERIELRIEQAKVDAVSENIGELKSHFLPTLGIMLDGRYTETSDYYSGVEVNGTFAGQPFTANINKTNVPYQTNANITLQYDLYSGGRDSARLQEGYSGLDKARARRDIVRRTIISNVENAYLELRKAQVVYRYAVRAVEFQHHSADVAHIALKEGRLSEINAMSEDLAADEKQIAVVTAGMQMRDKYAQYRVALGLPIDTQNREMPELSSDYSAVIELFEEDENAAEVRESNADIAMAQMRIRAAYADHYPTLTLIAQQSFVGRDSRSYGRTFDAVNRDYFYVGFRVSYSLFEGFRTDHAVKRALAEEERARLEAEQLRVSRQNTHREKSTQLNIAVQQLKLAEKRLKLARAKFEVARTRLAVGQLSELAMRRAELDTYEAEQNYLLTEIGVAQAKL